MSFYGGIRSSKRNRLGGFVPLKKKNKIYSIIHRTLMVEGSRPVPITMTRPLQTSNLLTIELPPPSQVSEAGLRRIGHQIVVMAAVVVLQKTVGAPVNSLALALLLKADAVTTLTPVWPIPTHIPVGNPHKMCLVNIYVGQAPAIPVIPQAP
jgi:hypothetical protein